MAARFGVTSDYLLFYSKAGGGWAGSDNLTITNTVTGASITGYQHQQRLAGKRGHRMGVRAQLVGEDRV